MTASAPAIPEDDRLINELRGYADLTVGHGMGIQVQGVHLRAILARLDDLQRRLDATAPVEHAAPALAWQTALAAVLPIVDEILQNDDYADLCGVNLIDALQAWSARNQVPLDPDTIVAVERALAGE